jgi:putative DNA primase/helicase
LRALLLSGAAAVPVSKFTDDKHVLLLVGCALNAVDELADSKRVASDRFKAIITGDRVIGRNVYASPVEFRAQAQHVFATNKLPQFEGGMDRGVRRRLMIMKFNRSIPLDERIENIGERAATEDPDLALEWLVAGAQRLVRNRRFTEPSSCLSDMREWLFFGDVVLAWLEEETAEDTGSRIPTTAAYRQFCAWAVSQGYRSNDLPDGPQFAQRLYASGRNILKERSATQRFFAGLRLKVSNVHTLGGTEHQ